MINKEAELYKDFLYKMLKNGGSLEPAHIVDLKSKCEEELEYIKENLEKYNLREIPIQSRTSVNPLKKCTMLPFAYRTEIVNQVVNYLLGTPIDYSYGEDTINIAINEFARYNDLDLLNMETLKDCCASGCAYRLMYIDDEGLESCINLPSDSVITLNDKQGIAKYAFYFYTELDETGEEEVAVCEFYDESNMYKYIGDDYSELAETEKHMFAFMPVINIYNNAEREPDFKLVEDLIDAVDEIMSNHQDEILEFRNAYMVFSGGRLDKDAYDKIIQTGAFEVPIGADVKFLTKNMDVNAVNTQREVLTNNIYKLSNSIDMEKFSDSSESGESRKWKLILLENRAKEKMALMKTFLKQMFKIYGTRSVIKGSDFMAHNINFQFNRSLPTDERYLGESLNLYKDYVSTRTLLSRVPFIDDVDAEIKRLQEEADMELRKDFLNNTITSDGHPVTNVNNKIKEKQAELDNSTGNGGEV